MDYEESVQIVSDLRNASKNMILSDDWRNVFSKAADFIAGVIEEKIDPAA